MPPIDPRLVLAKRFPLHAAIDQCYFPQIQKLCEEDAEFHVVRKVQNYETSVVHQACTLRGIQTTSKDILVYLIKNGAPLNELDSIGQSPLHYATSNPELSKTLLPILISEGAKVNVQRSTDGWTPLHLAAMFGRSDIVGILLQNGANPDIVDKDGRKPEEIARKHRFHALADLLNSPRKEHCPEQPVSSETNEPDVINLLGHTTKNDLASIKMKEKYTTWRDQEDNSLLHLAAWNGNLELCRWFFESPRGRKLVNVQNGKGASPLALAIINAHTEVVEEFFMNKHSKNHIILDSNLKTSHENIVHLLIQYLPTVHSKFVLKRKDLTPEIMNAVDSRNGNSPVLHCAERNNKISLKRILSSKAVKEQQLLDLGLTNKKGQTLLHLLAENKDEGNFKILLNDYNGLITPEIANLGDAEGDSCLIISLLRGSPQIVRYILEHPVASAKFNLSYHKGGLSPLHLVAEQGNIPLWSMAVSHPSCDLNARDLNGNTPPMTAAIKGNSKMLEAWLKSPAAVKSVDLSASNNDGDTILSLFMKNIPHKDPLISFISAVNLRSVINQPNASSEVPLTIAVQKENWDIVRALLSHENLKDTVGEDETEGVVDVHVPVVATGLTALTSILTARIKLTRQVQTHNMKKQRVLADECKKKCETLWALLQVVLLREKEIHGPTMIQGRDGGSTCIKKQMEAGKLIRAPDQDEVISQYVKHYQFVKKKKPPSTPLEAAKKVISSQSKEGSKSSAERRDSLGKDPSSQSEDSKPTTKETKTTKKPKSKPTSSEKSPDVEDKKTKQTETEVVNGQQSPKNSMEKIATDTSKSEKKSKPEIIKSIPSEKKHVKLDKNEIQIVSLVNGKSEKEEETSCKKTIETFNCDLKSHLVTNNEILNIEIKKDSGNKGLSEEKVDESTRTSKQTMNGSSSPPTKKEDQVKEESLKKDSFVEPLISKLLTSDADDDKFASFLKSKMSVLTNGNDSEPVKKDFETKMPQPKEVESPSAPPKEAESPSAPPKQAESPSTPPKEAESPSAPPKEAESPSAPPKQAESSSAPPKEAESPSAPPRKQKLNTQVASTQTDGSLKICKCQCTCGAFQ